MGDEEKEPEITGRTFWGAHRFHRFADFSCVRLA